MANLDVEKMQLRAKRDLIEDVYSKALGQMEHLPDAEYLEFCGRLLDQGVRTRDEKVTLGKHEKRVNQEWLSAYNEKHGTKLELAGERGGFEGGFILEKNRISVDCSWEMLLKVLQEKQESDVVKRLFPSE